MKKLVSILIPVHNAEQWLAATIQSVLDQSWENLEIILVDDGSTDNSLEIARSFASDKVKVISQKNAGASAARNRAFSASRGDYIQYLDADDLLAPDKIERQMLRLQKESLKTIASGPFFEFTGTVENAKGKPDEGCKDYKKPFDWLVDAAWDKAMFPPLVWLTPRNLIEAAGPWNEQLSYNDDPEFFARVLLKADKIAFCRDANSFYRRGIVSSLGSRKDAKAIESGLLSLDLVTKYMLEAGDTEQTRRACAYQYRKFIYSIYPAHAVLRQKAKAELKLLGVNGKYHFGQKHSARLSKMFGWKTVKWFRYVYYKVKNA